jgi:hypothetical protein
MTGHPKAAPVGPTSEPQGERRTGQRYRWDKEIALRPVHRGEDAVRWAWVQNLSRSGVSLLLSHRFEPGARLELRLPTSPFGPKRVVVGRVVHARTGPHGVTVLGCAFDAGSVDGPRQEECDSLPSGADAAGGLLRWF